MGFRSGLTKQKLVAIDWDAQDLRVVLFRGQAEGLELLKAVSIPIGPEVRVGEPESFGAFLREALRQAKIGARHALLCMPRDRVVLNTLRMPPTSPDELPSMVRFQITKELPFAAEQATLDFVVCGQFDPKLASDVLVAAVRTDEITFYRTVAHEAGLHVDAIGLRPHANLVALTRSAPDSAEKTTLVVDVGPILSEIDIIRKGVLSFSRAASVNLREFGAEDTTRYEDSRISTLPAINLGPDDASKQAVANVVVEVTRSYEAHRATDPTLRLDRIVVCGASGIEAQLAESLGARFGARAELFSPERALGLTPQRSRELRGFSAVLGLAMAHAERGLSQFDFLHPKKAVSKRALRMRKLPVAAACAVLFVGTGVSYHWRVVRPKVNERNELKTAYDEMKKREADLVAFKSQVDAVEQWRDDEQYWAEVLAAVTAAFPPEEEAYATRAVFETRIGLVTDAKTRKANRERVSTVTLTLRAARAEVDNELINRLQEAGFESVQPGRVQQSARRGSSYEYDLTVTATVPRGFGRADRAVIPPTASSAPASAPAVPEDATTAPSGNDESVPTSAPAVTPKRRAINPARLGDAS